MGMDFQGVCNDGRNIKLGQAEFVDVAHRMEILDLVWKLKQLK